MNRSDVVQFSEVEPGIIQITMQDRENKNTFSRELVKGLINAFRHIRESERYRVVVLTGYDTYFCSGGTKEGLLMLHEGQGKFTDMNIYSVPLECEIPVISAMQGHGIGGGFVFGLFADCVVLSRESVYTTNFMKYGFTPGMGATYVLPEKLGLGLAEEMLLSARTYRGADLEKRGVPFPVLPRAEVLEYALQLARDLAEKPRISLVTLKSHLVAEMRARLPTIVEQEIAMHDKTFHQPEVKARIENVFGN
ncbi:polyketide synthase [Pseudomonas batumici]|uniref:BatE n=2 Tax=Pseudomonas TaxID=286 RepID=D4NZE0_PSEFL|nr:polyketide synthase [Pseudomonas batumici]ADD82946.1 BatE [Pseudomonas fluorescens]KIH86011.1 BatE, batumin synthesis operon, Enoyl-CoA hydratase [Pseudomonas batumici]